jgi:hypothetical protein
MLDADPETRMATHMRCGVCCTASGENFEGKEAREFSSDGRQKRNRQRGVGAAGWERQMKFVFGGGEIPQTVKEALLRRAGLLVAGDNGDWQGRPPSPKLDIRRHLAGPSKTSIHLSLDNKDNNKLSGETIDRVKKLDRELIDPRSDRMKIHIAVPFIGHTIRIFSVPFHPPLDFPMD